jgi:hypothetical protein
VEALAEAVDAREAHQLTHQLSPAIGCGLAVRRHPGDGPGAQALPVARVRKVFGLHPRRQPLQEGHVRVELVRRRPVDLGLEYRQLRPESEGVDCLRVPQDARLVRCHAGERLLEAAETGKDLRAEEDRMRALELPEVSAESAAPEQAYRVCTVVLHANVPEIVVLRPERSEAVTIGFARAVSKLRRAQLVERHDYADGIPLGLLPARRCCHLKHQHAGQRFAANARATAHRRSWSCAPGSGDPCRAPNAVQRALSKMVMRNAPA